MTYRFKTTVIEDIDMEPCPFCGFDQFVIEFSKDKSCYYVRCSQCQAEGPFNTESTHCGDAAKLWNKRI